MTSYENYPLVKVETVGNFSYYTLETPRGNRWSFEEEDLEELYIEDTLWAWSRLLDHVRAEKDAS